MVSSEDYNWFQERVLPEGVSLQVLDGEKVVFTSSGKWLYPLLDLEEFLAVEKLDAKELFLHDQITGRAAAALTIRLGFVRVKSHLLSRLAEELYQNYQVTYYYDTRVDRILCQTENIIDDSMSLSEIYQLIQSRDRR